MLRQTILVAVTLLTSLANAQSRSLSLEQFHEIGFKLCGQLSTQTPAYQVQAVIAELGDQTRIEYIAMAKSLYQIPETSVEAIFVKSCAHQDEDKKMEALEGVEI